jgi:hypothetical protein
VALIDEQCAFTECLSLLIRQALLLGYRVKIHEVNRDLETQKMYVRDGKSKTLESRHLDKCAVDLVLVKGGLVISAGEEFRPLGEYWESLGGRWGGRFGLEDQPKAVQDAKLGWDSPHFEWRKGRI